MDHEREIREHNRRAWDRAVAERNRWTVPVAPETIAAARGGAWEVLLTPTRPVPRAWFPPLAGLEVLALASGGGQQAPILATAGARVTVLDQSPAQLAQDRAVAERERLSLQLEEGDMADLGRFADASFGLVFHPCANLFVPDVRRVWREAFRVLRSGGVLLAGFVYPVFFVFDEEPARRGEFRVRHRIPYSDRADLSDAELGKKRAEDEPLTFGHSLEDQIGGQCDAGFVVTAMYEDVWDEVPLSRVLPLYAATRALKP